jgi:hypothetical protein
MSGGRTIFPPKKQGETVILPFDFISQLANGVTISTQSVAATVWSGVDANPSAIISGSASASGTLVTQKITAGVAGCVYALVCTITTSDAQTLQMSAYLAILPFSTP